MGKHFLLVSVFFGLLGAGASAKDLLKPGRYAGYLHLKQAGLKLPAVLDTVHIPAQNGQETKLAAFLKLSFGAFRSHEYLTHFYWIEDYDWSASEMILDAIATGYGRDLTLNLTIDDSGKRIHGKVKSRRGSVDGDEIELLFLSPAFIENDTRQPTAFHNKYVYDLFPDVPIYPALTGSYASDCTGFRTLQFELSKQGGLTPASILPMEGYVIRGRVIGKIDATDREDSVLYTLNTFEDFLYNFYLGHVHFPHLGLQLCRRTVDSIACRNCKFKAIKEEEILLDHLQSQECGAKIRPLVLEKREGETDITRATLTRDLSGSEYQGQVHYEERDEAFPFSIDINVTGKPIAGDPTIGQRLLTFGPKVLLQGHGTRDQWKRFIPIDVSPIRLTDAGMPLTITGTSGNLLQVLKWTDRSIEGIYYSAVFGRVGTFSAFRVSDPDSLQGDHSTIPGTFLGEPKYLRQEQIEWAQTQLDLEWVPSVGTSPFPYNLGGNLVYLWDILGPGYTRNTFAGDRLEGVRFDPFTGVFGADMGDGSSRRSLLAKLGRDEIPIVLSSNFFYGQATTPFHRVDTLRRDREYAPLTLPDVTKGLGIIHVFLPYDAELFINGKQTMVSPRENYRSFSLSSSLPPDKPVTYTWEARFRTGKRIEHVLTVTPAEAKRRSIVIDFYRLQSPPR